MSVSGRGLPEYRGAMNPRSEISLLINRVECMVLPGTISQIDYAAAYARVSLKDTNGRGATTDWLRWTEDCAGSDREWSPPSVGERVMIFSPTGNINQAIIDRSFNTVDSPPNCDSPTIRRKTWVKPPEGEFFDFPFWEMETAADRTHVWEYLPTKGQFRHEIGDKVLIHWTEDFLMWRIGNTQYVLKDGSAVLTIADDIKAPTQRVEIRADINKVEVHANHEASVVVQRYDPFTEQPAKVEAQVGEDTALILDRYGVKAAFKDDASLVLSEGTAVLESKTSKAQLSLKAGISSLCLDGVSARLTPVSAVVGMAGGEVQITPAAIVLAASQLVIPQNVSSPSTPGIGSPFQAGPIAAVSHPTVKQTPQQSANRWPLSESKGPKYPRTGKPKQ